MQLPMTPAPLDEEHAAKLRGLTERYALTYIARAMGVSRHAILVGAARLPLRHETRDRIISNLRQLEART
jgi:hypothetical protein